MHEIKKVLMLGPFPLPTTGVSLANHVIFEELSKSEYYNVKKINTSYGSFDEKPGTFSIGKMLYFLRIQLMSYRVFTADVIYITPGQTFYGVLKYALFVWMASLSRKRIVQHIHGNFLGHQYEMLTGFKKDFFKSIMNKTNSGIVLSASLRNNFQAFIPQDKIYELKNFVINDLFFSEELIKAKNFSVLRIVFLSNLMLEKGIFDLLESLVILEQEGVPYKAKIAGNIAPENRTRLDAYLLKLHHTEYIGVVDVPAKTALFKWSNVFVLPTYYTMEGQPISILEAMATGNLILTTNHAGIPDVFKNGINGFYVSPKTPTSIVTRLKKINLNKDTISKIAIHNAREARESYRVSTFIKNLIRIINS